MEENSQQPKKPKSSYMFYCLSRRESLKIEQPNLGPIDVSRTLSEEWINLSDEVKDSFAKMAEADKVRYETEMKSVNA